MSDALFLVADVGGTNTRVAMAEGGIVLPDTIRRYSNRDFANLAPVLRANTALTCPAPTRWAPALPSRALWPKGGPS